MTPDPTNPAVASNRPSLVSLLVVVGGAAIALATPAAFRAPGPANVLDGSWAAQYEHAFDAGLSIRPAAIVTWEVIQYAAFHEGRSGVLIGDDGWLFTTEDFVTRPTDAAETSNKADIVQRLKEFLAKRGITLVVALVPDKSRVYAEHLGRYRRPQMIGSRYADFRNALLARGILVPDLLGRLVEAKPMGQVFLRTDTHWTPFGADLAAGVIAAAARPALADAPHSASTTTTGDIAAYAGDLLAFVPLGPFAWIGPAPDSLEAATTTSAPAATDASGLLGDVELPAALVGTSYSANTHWNFVGALSVHLGVDVLNAAEEGKGPLVPMAVYLSGEAFKDTPPRVLIWEIPERTLGVIYDTSALSEALNG